MEQDSPTVKTSVSEGCPGQTNADILCHALLPASSETQEPMPVHGLWRYQTLGGCWTKGLATELVEELWVLLPKTLPGQQTGSVVSCTSHFPMLSNSPLSFVLRKNGCSISGGADIS